jgi:hypothetical protein
VRFRAFGGAHAAALYTLIAVWATWPLAGGLSRDVAWDLGDPVLVIWVLAWNCTQLLAILGGDVGRVATYFDANIFAPATHTLAYSEHFIGQALQVLPVYALTGNAVLCYNLLYLSTFVLSGLGAFLFVREITGSRAAGVTAGLLFAFAPYRFPQSSHLQVLSSQWMPLALYGFRRYFDTGRHGALAWGAAALVMQNLSCGYYLLYFSPFAAAYILAEMAARGLWRSGRTWRDVAVAGAAVASITVPFFLPYLALRDLQPSTRSLAEVSRYSADIYSYFTAFSDHPIWGALQTLPKPEGQLFPGIAAVLLAAIGLVPRWGGGSEDPQPRTGGGGSEDPQPRRPGGSEDPRPRTTSWPGSSFVIALLTAAAAVHVALLIAVLFVRRFTLDIAGITLSVSDATQLLLRATVAGALALALSPRTRAWLAAILWPRGAWLVALLVAVWLSLGPAPESMGRPLDLASPYRALYDAVPGFDGVRAPSRYWMVGLLALSVLGGLGAMRLASRAAGRAALAALWLLCLAEARVSPFVVNGMSPVAGFVTPEARLRPPDETPAVYTAVARGPADAVIAELPLGQPDFDLRAMYYSTVHWRKLVNGYSGFTPVHYGPLVAALGGTTVDGERAWAALRQAGATAVIVHEGAYPDGAGARLSLALRERGAREVLRDGSDVLMTLPYARQPGSAPGP